VLELHDRGQPIEVISEGEFLQMVGGASIHMAQ
jgi:DNA polymerase-3 subunit epsilon